MRAGTSRCHATALSFSVSPLRVREVGGSAGSSPGRALPGVEGAGLGTVALCRTIRGPPRRGSTQGCGVRAVVFAQQDVDVAPVLEAPQRGIAEVLGHLRLLLEHLFAMRSRSSSLQRPGALPGDSTLLTCEYCHASSGEKAPSTYGTPMPIKRSGTPSSFQSVTATRRPVAGQPLLGLVAGGHQRHAREEAPLARAAEERDALAAGVRVAVANEEVEHAVAGPSRRAAAGS